MKKAFRKSKPALMVMSLMLIGMSFLFLSCLNNGPSSPPTPIGGISKNGGTTSNPTSSGTNYVVGAVDYLITSQGSGPVTTYLLTAAVAVSNTPVINAAVTFTDPNGTFYSLPYSGSNQAVGGVTCGLYQDAPSSFATIGAFKFSVMTSSGISSGSVTAINSIVSFPSPYTTLSWSGTSQENTVSLVSEATPSASYSQSSTTSPISIPASTYTSGTTYDYQFLQANEAATINGGTGSLGYLQTSIGTFVAP
jgi:hypothetical protein